MAPASNEPGLLLGTTPATAGSAPGFAVPSSGRPDAQASWEHPARSASACGQAHHVAGQRLDDTTQGGGPCFEGLALLVEIFKHLVHPLDARPDMWASSASRACSGIFSRASRVRTVRRMSWLVPPQNL